MTKQALKKTFTLLASLGALSILSGCASDAITSKASGPSNLPHEERRLTLAPLKTLLPSSSPWGGVVAQGEHGKLLAAALHGQNALAIWSIGPDRRIQEVGQAKVGYHPDDVAALDNHTIAVAEEGAGKISFWTADARFPPKKQGEIPTPFPTRSLLAHDLDGDGQRDLVLAPYQGLEVAILWGEGNLRFSAPLKLEAANTPWRPRVADWNADGRLDLLWSDWLTGSVRLQLNQGQRKFSLTMLQPPQSGTPRQLGVGDIDGNGRIDAVMAMETGKAARILYNQGDKPVEVEDVPAPVWGYVAAEVMKDGTLVLAEEGRVILARKIDGSWTYRVLPAGSMPTPILLNDLDDDGNEDLIIFHSAGGGIGVAYGPLWEKAAPFTIPSLTHN